MGLEFAGNLLKMWGLMAYKDKVHFQHILFPEGISYNKKNDLCRTKRINSVLWHIAQLSMDIAKIKSGEPKFIFDFPALVGPLGIEPSTHRL